MVAGFFELRPYFVRVFSWHITYLFPLFLNLFHDGSRGGKIGTFLQFFGFGNKGSFSAQVVVLVFLDVFIERILERIEVSDRGFKRCPSGFVYIGRNFSSREKSGSQSFHFFYLLQPLRVGVYFFGRQGFNFGNDFFFLLQVFQFGASVCFQTTVRVCRAFAWSSR